MSEQNQPEESPIMIALRNYVLGHGGLGGVDQKETQLAMNVEPSSGTAKGYANGGIVMPDLGDLPIPGSDFDVANQSSTFKTNGNVALPPIPPALLAAAAQKQIPPAAQAPAPGPRPAPMAPPTPPMPSMGDVLQQAQTAGNQLYGAYTPERRNELYAYLAEKANGMPNAIGAGLASVGDAIARGYGRDAGANFLDKTLQGTKASREEALGAFDTAQKGALAETSTGMELQKMDPNSAISKVSRAAYAPMLAKLGYSPAAIAKMSGANVETAAKVAADLGGKEMENLFHQAQLIVESQFHKAELGEKESARKAEALKTLSEHPIASMLPTASNAALKQQAGLQDAGTGQAGGPATGPLGQTTVKDGKTYEWSPITQKYHLKQS
jgi:hypothetical protein